MRRNSVAAALSWFAGLIGLAFGVVAGIGAFSDPGSGPAALILFVPGVASVFAALEQINGRRAWPGVVAFLLQAAAMVVLLPVYLVGAIFFPGTVMQAIAVLLYRRPRA